MDKSTRICAPDSAHTWEDLQSVCAAEGRSTSLLYTECALACAEGETSKNSHCSCAEDFALSVDRTRCVSKAAEDCPRTLDMRDRAPRGETCIANATCDPRAYKLALDGKECVASCDLWFEDEASGELRCATECPDWWYEEKDGFCENKAWRRSVAIFIFTCVFLIILFVVLGAVLQCCGKCQRMPRRVKYQKIDSMPVVEPLPDLDVMRHESLM